MYKGVYIYTSSYVDKFEMMIIDQPRIIAHQVKQGTLINTQAINRVNTVDISEIFGQVLLSLNECMKITKCNYKLSFRHQSE